MAAEVWTKVVIVMVRRGKIDKVVTVVVKGIREWGNIMECVDVHWSLGNSAVGNKKAEGTAPDDSHAGERKSGNEEQRDKSENGTSQGTAIAGGIVGGLLLLGAIGAGGAYAV